MGASSPTIVAAADSKRNVKHFVRSLRAAPRSPRTAQRYEEACLQFSALLVDQGVP